MSDLFSRLLDPEVIESFLSEGYVLIRGIISGEHVAQLRQLVEQCFVEVTVRFNDRRDLVRGDGVSLMRMFEYHEEFRNPLVNEPLISLIETILGSNCHMVAQNALRTPRDQGIVNWHIDDALFFPFLDSLDASVRDKIRLPCYTLNLMLALSDVDNECHGPTQVVARSHRTGRVPEYQPYLVDEVEPVSLLASAGDAYLINSQTWHRGAQNRSERVRYVLTTTFGRRFISQRLYPFLNYQMPEQVVKGSLREAATCTRNA